MEGVEEKLKMKLQEKILERFGFIPMGCYWHEKGAKQYVHLSGGMFAMIDKDKEEKSGFWWEWNHTLGHKYRSFSPCIGDDAFQDRMLADFRKVCRNDQGRLAEILNSLNEE